MKKIIITLITMFFLCPFVNAQSITINGTREINDEIQLVFFTLTVAGTDYRMESNTPILSGQDLQNYFNSRTELYLHSLFHNVYPGADISEFEDEETTKVEQFQAWIAAGCVNPDGTVIDKVEWQGWDIDKVQAHEDLKASVFYRKTDEQINDYIDQEWAAGNQKQLFKQLVKEICDIVRKGN